MDPYDQIRRVLTESDEDYQKAKGGNKAAKTRVRKAMQEIKSLAQQVRQDMLAQSETPAKE